jgi:hypothetical protein
MENDMRCLTCRSLEATFKAKWIEFTEASSRACYGVSNQFAAYLHVEMERAKAELEEHRSLCLSAANDREHAPVSSSLRSDVIVGAGTGSVPTAA